jgi:bacillithiol biosynthesis deacetylase BshB1
MSKLDVLAIGPHPDDVELACGGTLALCARQGRRVGILHLSRGERGTRGTPEQRLAEAERAAAALGAVELAFLDFGDGALRCGQPEEDALIEVLRTWRPELVLGPPRHDRHPDHHRAHHLVAAAAFYSGLVARGDRAMPVHRPAAVFSYMQHHSFEPTFVVDVTAVWEVKVAALAAYRSQLYQAHGPDAAGAEPVPSPGGLAEAESRAEHAAHAVPPGSRPGPEGEAEAGPGSGRPRSGDGEPGSGGGTAPGREDGGPVPATKVSSREFRLAVEGRARHFGLLIGAELGEPFWSPLPLAVADLLALLPGGLR